MVLPLKTILAIVMVLTSVFVLEKARYGIEIEQFSVGATPVTQYTSTRSNGPVVVIAHGFAGSQQMMQGYALPMARAGYRVFVFEFMGHGRHPDPMSGDASSVDGTTRLLVAQTGEVIDAVQGDGGPVALVGHSMATDILVRVAAARSDVGPMVLVSAFSREITADAPANLLLVTGAWESGLRAFARDAVRMVSPDAAEGDTARTGDVVRRAVAAPWSEHVSVLQSRVGRRAAVAWLDQAFVRVSDVAVLPTGWAILGVLGGLVLAFGRIVAWVPARPSDPVQISSRRLTGMVVIPAVATPLIAVALNPEFLPVLVADYLGLHLAVFGVIQLILLRFWRVPFGAVCWVGFAVLLVWCGVFGLALDRYAASFWPHTGRIWIIAVMVVGAVPFMVADTILTTHRAVLGRLAVRIGFLLSLGFAVLLDFENLFFLVMIAPVLVLFFLVFGTMGRATARRCGPLAAGLALGIVLAWALGVSFPLFQT